jgi:hypothetical protein
MNSRAYTSGGNYAPPDHHIRGFVAYILARLDDEQLKQAALAIVACDDDCAAPLAREKPIALTAATIAVQSPLPG